jgi:DNA processing protein
MNAILQQSQEYPPLLKEIPDPPKELFALGDQSILAMRAAAIVGTRRATPEGKRIASTFAKEFAKAGVAVISGLAFGIDTAAHEGCLEGNGKTIAVLPCGLDKIYPVSNGSLARRIRKNGGAIISEYKPATDPLPYRFLERNRLISGLSESIVVIECPKESGSLVTARLGAEQGRNVFVVPGPISHPNFCGSHELIRKGAELVTKPEDVLESMGISKKTEPLESHKIEHLTKEEKMILEVIANFQKPADIDKILELTKLEPRITNRAITMLITQEIITETPGGSYVLL